MRVPQLDYTSLKAAIQDQYNANSGQFANRGIQIATESARIAKQSGQLSKESLELNKSYQDKQTALNWAKVGVQGLQAVSSVLGAVGQIKTAVASEQSKGSLIDYQSGLKTAIQDSISNGGGTEISSDGQLVYGEDVNNYVDQYINWVDNQKWDSQTKQATINSAKQLFANSDTQTLSFIKNKFNSEIATQFSSNLNKAMAIDESLYSFDQLQSDLKPEQLYGAGFAEIDSQTWLTSNEKQIQKAQYSRTVDANRTRAVMNNVARQGGDLNAVGDWAKTKYGLDDNTINTLIKSAEVSGQNYVNGTLIPNAKKVVDDCFSTYGTDSPVAPDIMIERLKTDLKAQGHSQEQIDQIVKAARIESNARATELLGKITSGHDTADATKLLVMKDKVEQTHEFLKGSADGAYDSAMKSLNSDLKVMSDKEQEEAKAYVKNFENVISTNQAEIEALSKQVSDGVISGYDALNQIRYSQTAMKLNFTEEELSNIEKNCPTVYKALQAYDNKAIELCKTVEDLYGKEYKYLFDAYLKGFEDDLFTLFDGDEFLVAEAKSRLLGSFIDSVMESRLGDIDSKVLKQRMDDAKNQFVKSVYKTVSTSPEGGGFFTQNTTEQALDTIKAFESNPGAAYLKDEDKNGEAKIVWLDPTGNSEKAFDNAIRVLKPKVEEAIGVKNLVPKIEIVKNGASETPIPVYTNPETNDKYTIDSSEVVYQLNSGSKDSESKDNEIAKIDTKDVTPVAQLNLPEIAINDKEEATINKTEKTIAQAESIKKAKTTEELEDAKAKVDKTIGNQTDYEYLYNKRKKELEKSEKSETGYTEKELSVIESKLKKIMSRKAKKLYEAGKLGTLEDIINDPNFWTNPDYINFQAYENSDIDSLIKRRK